MGNPVTVVGYDGSPSADVAVDAAAALLPTHELLVVHVWAPPSPAGDQLERLWAEGLSYEELVDRVREEGRREACATAERGAARARSAGATIARPVERLAYGGAWFELVAAAREQAAAALVVGTRGAGLTRDPLGRVADAVVRLADRPVLVVPEHAERAAAGAPLVVGYDGSAAAAEAIRLAGELFGGRRALVVHVGDEETAVEGSRLAAAGGLAATALAVPASGLGRPAGRSWHPLVEAADEHGAAAVVVGRRGAGALRRALLGSVTAGLLHHVRHPVLVAPAPPASGERGR